MEEGAIVFINDVNRALSESTAEELGGHALACDVSDSSAVDAMFKKLSATSDRLDILVNNAGISGIEGDNNAQSKLQAALDRQSLCEWC